MRSTSSKIEYIPTIEGFTRSCTCRADGTAAAAAAVEVAAVEAVEAVEVAEGGA